MGRVKSLMIKKAAQQLYEEEPEFSNNFENNKKLLKNTIYYKSVRNKVAGEIVKLKRKEKKKHVRVNKEDDDGRAEEDLRKEEY